MALGVRGLMNVQYAIKDDKVYVERHVRRKGFHRRVGHRQKYLAVQVESINA